MAIHTWFYKSKKAKENRINESKRLNAFCITKADELTKEKFGYNYEELIKTIKDGFEKDQNSRLLDLVLGGEDCKPQTEAQKFFVFLNTEVFIEIFKDYDLDSKANDAEEHDLFRHRNFNFEANGIKDEYDEFYLSSLQETLDYLEKWKEEITYEGITKEHSLELLKKFWNKYPEGCITFG